MLEQTPKAQATDVAATAIDPDVDLARIDLEAIADGGPSDEAGEYQKKKLGLFFWFCVAWLVAMVLAALLADVLPLKDPDRAFPNTFRQGPSAEHWFGNDNIGKDVFARTIHGARRSIGVAASAQFMGFMLGGTIGLLAAYYRGRIEGILTGGIDVLLAFPALILALVLSIFLSGTEIPVLRTIAGTQTKALIVALGILTIPTIARITRAGVLVNTEREYVLAARTLGARDLRIMVREVLPNVLPAMFAFALIGVSFLMIIEAALAFLGVGDVNEASWGVMIAFGRANLDDAPHAVFFPAFFLFLTVLSINYIGDRLRQYFDVRESAI